MIINKKLLDDLAPVKEDNSSSWFKSTSKTKKIKKLWEDGYDVGDVTKTILNVGDTILSSTADALTNVGKGFMSTVEGTVDAGRYFLGDAMKKSANLQADIWNKLGNKSYADSLRKSGQQLFNFEKKNAKVDVTGALLGETNDIFKENWSKKVDEKSIFAEKSDSVAQGVGNVGAFVGMSNIAPVLGGNEIGTVGSFLNSFSSSYGNSRTEAYKNGADDETANKAGLINGFAEAISEQFFDGMPGMKSAGWGDKLVGKIGESVSKYFNGNVGKNVMKILDASGEGFEEIISNALVTTGNNIAHYFDKNYTYGMENQSGNVIKDIGDSITSQESWDAFISAMLTSAITNGGAKLINQTQNNHIIKEYAKENNMTVDEVKAQFNDIANRTLNQEVTNNYKDKVELEEQIKKNLASNIKDDIKSGQNKVNLSEIQQGLMSRENYIKAVGHKTTDANGKQVYTTSSEGLNLIESYRAYGGDEGKISEINNIQNFMNKRNLEARFDATKFYDKKVNAVWQIEDGKRSVIFDPNASIDSIMEEVAAHEMTHDIISQNTKSSNSFFKDVLDYAKQNKEYKTLRKDIEDSYSEYYDKTSNDFSNKIDEEIVAKTIEKQLGTQEYITRVVNNNPNLAQKMYRWVIDKLQTSNTIKDNNEVTGFKSEKLYWEGVKNKFEKAYNERNAGSSDDSTRYSIVGYEGINNLPNSPLKDVMTEKYKKAKEMLKNNESNDSIFKETKFYVGTDGKLKTEISDEMFDLKIKDNIKSGQVYKMEDFIDDDYLFAFYPELKDYEIKITNYDEGFMINTIKYVINGFKKSNPNGSYDSTTKTVFLNENRNTEKALKQTLIHEIQHAIQDIEGFESGASSLLSKEKYIKSNGENEAKLTSKRLEYDKEDRKADPFYAIQEKQTKERLAAYYKNRKIIDKFKDKLYNCLERKISHENPEKDNFKIETEKRGIKDSASKSRLSKYEYLKDDSGEFKYSLNSKEEPESGSFSLEQRVSGDELLDAQDLIEEIKSVGANVDKNGYVTLYHQTTNENADKIKQTGKMIANEPYVYFSTSKDASQSDGRGNTKLEFKIPAEKIMLDDLFSDNADVKIKLDSGKELDISNYIVNENGNNSFSFDKKAKRYDDLNQTNYIEYFTKENGDIRISLIDTNNNLVNQFSSSPSKEISKLLGENIGEYILKNSSNDTKRIYIGNDINNLGKETDYFMNHRPSNDYGNASNFENNMSGIFEHPEWYMNMNEPYNIQSLNALKKVRNNPEADITIYRATIGDKINPGDWVTPSKKYAEYHNQSQFDGKANILEMKVKAKDVLFAGDDINEFGYFPTETRNSLTTNKELKTKLKIKGTKTKFGELFNNEISPIKEEIKNVSDKLDNLSSQISNIQNQAQNNTIKDDIAPVKNETESINKDTHNENNTTIENNKPSAYIETPKNLNFDRQKYTPLTENDSNLLTDALMNDKNYLKSLSDEDSNHYDNEKLVNNLSKNVSSNLGLGKNQREELKNIIKETIDYDYTTDELADILEKKFTRVENKIVNEEAREIKSLIRTIPIKVSDGIKMNIPDYNDFSRRNFGKIRFTRDGVSVDVAYKALNERLPNYFPDNIVNPSDQLLKIAEVANIANEVVESVEIPKEAIDNIADYITDSIIQDKYNSNLEKNSTLLKDIQFDFVDDILPTTIRTQESIDNYIDSRDITPLRKEVKKRELKEQKEKMSRILKEAFINKNYIIDQTALATGNKEITFTADMLNNVVGEVQYNINGKQTDINGNTIGKGIKEIFAPAKKAGMYEIFNDYLIQKSNIERHAIGKGSRVPLEISKQIVNAYESKYPVLKEWTKDVYKYFDNILLEQYKSGIVSKDQYENFRGENGIYRSYVPFYENTVEESKYYDEEGNVKPFSTLLKAKGNAQDTSGLLSVEDAMVKQTYKYKSAIRANELYKEIVPYLGKYESELPADSRKNPTELDSLFTDVDGTKVLSAYVDGKKMSAQISEELYNELSNTYENKIKELEKDFSIITNPIQKISNIRRNLITTWNPIFLVRNAIKDIQDAPINSKHTKDMLKTYFGVGEKAAIMELKAAKTKEAQQFLALYGSENTYGDYSELDSKSKNVISKFGKKLVELNELIELAPRYAEFKASLKNGDSLQEAIYNAREVTTNFGRGGYITKALNRNGFTFLNASVQGLDKAIRNITGQNGAKGVTSVILKGALLSVAPAIINELLFGVGDDKDEDYEALPNYIKDNYYLIKVGNNFIRIPKGRINSVFGSLARRTIEGIEGEENPFKGYLDNSWSQIGVGDPSSNNILAPIKQVKENKAWHGGDIVPTRLQNKPASEQTDAKIDSISNFIGKTFNVGPYKVNYLLDQYSGGIGDVLLPMLSQETKNGADNIFEYLISPLSDSFVVNSTDDNKYPGNFFEKKEELQIQSNSDYATDEDILKYKYFSDVSKELSDLYKERREVQSDTTITQKEKYLKVQKIQKEINSISKNGLTNYNGVNITGNYARVDDKEYYKDTQNEWKKVNDSDSEFIAGMRSNEKSSYFVAKNEISKITKNYKEQIEKQENGAKEVQEQLKREKQKNITNVIINSNLENYSKAMLYAKYYSSEKVMNNVYNAGYDIDTYIDALYNISEIQEKYSKENGYKSATRKKAIYSYINSLNMNIPQKAMLIKKYYSSFKTYNKQIVDYISELDISYEEKMNLIEQNKMKIKNGRVYW